jgi:ABC-type branched-subunit amino acid transport system ATPase component
LAQGAQLVRDLADRVFILHYGRMLAEGSPQQVLSDPGVIEAYVDGTSRL